MPRLNPLRLAALALLLGPLAGPATPSLAAGADAIAAQTRAASANEPLPAEVVFTVRPEATAPDRIEIRFGVHKDYYLYRSRLKFAVAEGAAVGLGTPVMPKGDMKTDQYFGEQEVYHHDFVVQLPVSRGSREAFTLPLQVSWQGCWNGGLCYVPTTKTFDVAMPRADSVVALPEGGSSVSGGADGYVSEQDWLANKIRNGNLFLMAGLFFLAGLGLAFTPCVLPMVPIVAGIIAGGGGKVTRARAFSLSLIYVLGMAATYTAAGVAFAAAV